MDGDEACSLADKAVSESSGQHLTDLESSLFKALWLNPKQTYAGFADSNKYSEDYVKEVGAGLWKSLSQALGEPVRRRNFQEAIERYRKRTGDIDILSPNKQIDWNEAPSTSCFFGRQEELRCLESWIVDENQKLIAILGIGGIGKTILAAKIGERVKDQFDCIVWRELRNAPPLSILLGELVPFLSNQRDTTSDIKSLLKYFQTSRCLVVLDNIESILQAEEYAGRYRSGYEDYGELLNTVKQTNHQSCLVLTSREQPIETIEISDRESSTRSLYLCGASESAVEVAQSIIQTSNLSGSDDQIYQLCSQYDFNPLALRLIAKSIRDLFDNEIGIFLEENTLVFNGIRQLLDQQFSRLTPLEKTVMYWLAINRESTSASVLIKDIVPTVAKPELFQILESLHWRSLVEVKSAGRFTLQPVIMEYVTNEIIETIVVELTTVEINLFVSHALLKVTVDDYVRESQIRLLLAPIAERLQTTFSSRKLL